MPRRNRDQPHLRRLRPRNRQNQPEVDAPQQEVQQAPRNNRQNRRRPLRDVAPQPEGQRNDAPVPARQPINAQDDQQAAPPPPKQMRTTAVQAGDGNNINNTDPLVMPCANEIDIIISQQLKEKIWNLEYVDFAQLLRQNSQYYFNVDQKQHISVENGKLVLSSKSSTFKSVDNIEVWTEAFSNYSKVLIQRHPSLASDLFTYMSLIRGATSDAPFDRIYQYDRQFRLRVSQNHTKSWAQIYTFLWLQFIAKGAQGVVYPMNSSSYQPCYNYNFKGECKRMNCTFRHNCMKCSLMHPAMFCVRFRRTPNIHQNINRPRFYNPAVSSW